MKPKDKSNKNLRDNLDFILFKHFFKNEPARAVDSLKAQEEIMAAIESCVPEYWIMESKMTAEEQSIAHGYNLAVADIKRNMGAE